MAVHQLGSFRRNINTLAQLERRERRIARRADELRARQIERGRRRRDCFKWYFATVMEHAIAYR